MNNKTDAVSTLTISAALTEAKQKFQASEHLVDSHTHTLDAELLLSHCLKKPRSYLRAWPEQTLNPEQQRQFAKAVQRRMLGEPIAYLLEQREFWDLKLRITSDTLIPRPETETLVEAALDLIPEQQAWQIADLGTGSGAVALALAKHRPMCRLTAIDNSELALKIAEFNAQQNSISNIDFVLSHWFEQLAPQHFQMIVSNPPYVAHNDPHLNSGDVAFEPRSALAAGPEGLDDLSQIIAQSTHFLVAKGYLLVEHGYDQADSVAQLYQQAGFEKIAGIQDLSGKNRVTLGQLPAR